MYRRIETVMAAVTESRTSALISMTSAQLTLGNTMKREQEPNLADRLRGIVKILEPFQVSSDIGLKDLLLNRDIWSGRM